jgi:hypothetical protein
MPRHRNAPPPPHGGRAGARGAIITLKEDFYRAKKSFLMKIEKFRYDEGLSSKSSVTMNAAAPKMDAPSADQ